MQGIGKTALIAFVFGLLATIGGESAFAGSPDCTGYDGTSGLRACVRFDNLTETPTLDTDYLVSFDGNGIPSVEFVRGKNTGGTIYEWRVWSEDNTGTEGDIGSLTAFGEFDYVVTIQDDSVEEGPGAADLGGINLDPSDAGNYSRIRPGHVSQS